MSFGTNTLTIVGHLILIWSLFRLALAGVRLHGFQGCRSLTVTFHDLALGSVILAFILSIERAYYVTARMLKHSGVNLWELHPAPELLSVFVAIGIYGLMVNIEMLTSTNRAQTFRGRSIELAGVIACFCTLAILGG